jgi:hypothetical protein
MIFPKPVITREHGSWAVLFVPMIVGIAYAGQATFNNILLAFSVLGVFLSYLPFHTILRELNGIPQGKEKVAASYLWGAVYMLAGLVFACPLVLQGYVHLFTAAALGALAFFGNYILSRKGRKSIAGDLTAVAGLTLSAPAAYYVSTGSFDLNGAVLWILNFLFFGCSVFYVHMKISAASRSTEHLSAKEKLKLGKLNILYHLFVIAVVILLSLFRWTVFTVVIAFVPMIVHAVYGTIQLNERVRFKKLGFLLLAQSIVFGVLLMFTWS